MQAAKKENRWKLNKLLVLSFSLVCCVTGLSAQIGLTVQQNSVLPIKVFKSNIPNYDTSGLFMKLETNYPSVLNNFAKQPTIYSFDHLALFCKIEVQLEKAVKFPVKFRLGDVQYVDKLEGKGTDRY